MCLARRNYLRLHGSNRSEKAAAIFGNSLPLVAFEVSQVQGALWQRAHASEPRAESVDEARPLERNANKNRDARLSIRGVDLAFAHSERGSGDLASRLLHSSSMLTSGL